MKKRINVGLLGLGTVGSGVYSIMKKRRAEFKRLVNADVVIKSIAIKSMAELKDRASLKVDKAIVTTNAESVVHDPDIDIVVEVIGGREPARSLIAEAIRHGKSVVTANKEVLANYGEEILGLADSYGVDLYFEASVGGGIPIVHPLKEGLAGNKISRVMGIVNGTTNYILTRMSEDGSSFKEALDEAKQNGFAERDVAQDVEGHDAAAKIAILSCIAFNARVQAPQVYREGISRITPDDIRNADEMGYVIKLLATGREAATGLDVRVHPAMLPKSHPLAGVREEYNAIFVEGDAVGELMFFGKGAGSLPAASAVVGDIVAVARNLQYNRSGKIGCTCFEKKAVMKIDEAVTSYYLLVESADQPGVLAKISKVFGDAKVSLASVIQKNDVSKNARLVFVTYPVKEKNLRAAVTKIEKLDVVKKVINVIRVESD
jgi:homoserine dehydrogenase